MRSTVDIQLLRERLSVLRDDELLRQALLAPGDFTLEALGVLAEILAERFGPFSALWKREVERTGNLVARLPDVRGFARLRGPGEPVLGGPDVPPYDGMLFLATGGVGFVPTSASPDTVFQDFAREAFEGPVAEWLGPQGTEWPQNAPREGPRPLPLPLRARLDPATAWIDRTRLLELSLGRQEWRLRAQDAADAVFRLVEHEGREALEAWSAGVGLPLSAS